MRRRFPMMPLSVLALSLLVAVSAIALALTVGGDATADSPAVVTVASHAAPSLLESQQPSLFTTSASGCTTPSKPVPHTGCIREGQCCRCPCDFVGTCSTFQGELICICPCAQ